MKARILGLLATALLAGTTTANAGIVVLEDSTQKLSGTFSFKLNESDVIGKDTSPYGIPNSYDLLPDLPGDDDADNVLFGTRFRDDEKIISQFGSRIVGVGDDPFVDSQFEDLTSPWSDEGSYTNPKRSGLGAVYWRFSDVRDSGNPAGVFSGAFCFSPDEATCRAGTAPEPGTLALLGLGLAGLAASRRRKR